MDDTHNKRDISRSSNGNGGILLALALALAIIFAPIIIVLGMFGKFLLGGLFKNVLQIEAFKKFRKYYTIICLGWFGLAIATCVLLLILTPNLFEIAWGILCGGNITLFVLSIVFGNKIYKKHKDEIPDKSIELEKYDSDEENETSVDGYNLDELLNSVNENIIEENNLNNVNNNNITDNLEAIKKLKELLDLGVITPKEFEKKKKELLCLKEDKVYKTRSVNIFNIIYAIITIMNTLFTLATLVFVSLTRENPLDVYYTMPVQYLTILTISICNVVIEVIITIKLFKGKLTKKFYKFSLILFLISCAVSIFILVDTTLSFFHCHSYWVFNWLILSFSIAVIFSSITGIIYGICKNNIECNKNRNSLKVLAYFFTFIICACSIGIHIFWLNSEKIFINKITNELTEVNFFGRNLEKIIIPEEVTSIDDDSFKNCSNLESIVIPNSITRIGSYAFYNCYSLMNIYYCGTYEEWNSIQKANCGIKQATVYLYSEIEPEDEGNYWHYDSDGKTPVVWKVIDFKFIEYDGGIEIIKYTGNGTNIVLPSTIHGNIVTGIGYEAFSECSSIISIEIPNSVKRIDDHAFSGCNSLENITIPDSKFIHAFNKRNLKKIVITGGTSIDGYAFSGCTSLISIEIPNSVISIGWGALSGCDNLETISIPFIGDTLNGTKETSFGVIFGGYDSNSNVPSSLKEVIITGQSTINSRAFNNCTNLECISILEGVTNISKGAFNSCTSLTSINVDLNNQYYKSIEGNLYSKDGKRLIQYALGKKETIFEIPEGVTTINEHAFEGSNIKGIKLSKTITHIETNVIRGIKNVEIPNTVKTIDSNALTSTNGINVYYYGTIKDWCDIVFEGSQYINNIYLLDENGNIEYNGNKFSLLQEVIIQDEITKINDYAFEGYQPLKNVVIGDSVVYIGEWAFYWIVNLESVVIGESVKNIGYSAFRGGKPTIYYKGDISTWNAISIEGNNDLLYWDIYYYSETKPIQEGYYWHYVDGNPTIWK